MTRDETPRDPLREAVHVAGNDALASILHATFHPGHPRQYCADPNAALRWLGRFQAEYQTRLANVHSDVRVALASDQRRCDFDCDACREEDPT